MKQITDKKMTKRIRKRNFVATQWIPALELGGGIKTAMENPSLLDPQTTEWFEDRLEQIALSPKCRYLIYQIEETKEEAAHYQIYLEFNEPVDKQTVIDMMHRTTDVDQRRGPRPNARHYCMKGNCGVADCQHTWQRHDDRKCHEFANEVKQSYREFGVWHTDGQRVDLQHLLLKLDEAPNWNAVLRNKDLSLELAKYSKFAKEYFDAKPPTPLELELRPWQQDLSDELSQEADDRKIIWYFDPVGGQGKSTMTKYLARNHEAILVGGQKKDILYAYDNQRIVLFDLSRTAEGRVSYSAMEDLKNGVYFVSKFTSKMVCRDFNAHVVIFANWLPDTDALSQDRWDIRLLRENRVINLKD
jgi:hypothetical protein